MAVEGEEEALSGLELKAAGPLSLAPGWGPSR